jgi:DNA-binding GntR family transcriptional regulator
MREPSLAENREALQHHRALIDAIAGRDAARAREAMREALGDFPSDVKRAWERP